MACASVYYLQAILPFLKKSWPYLFLLYAIVRNLLDGLFEILLRVDPAKMDHMIWRFIEEGQQTREAKIGVMSSI